MSACATPATPAAPRGAAVPRPRARPGRPAAARRPARRAFFWAVRPQHMTGSERLAGPIADLLAALATVGAVALWGLALHLVAG